MEPNKLSVSSNIVHKPLSVNCLTPTKECRRSLRPTLAPYILLSLTNQANPSSRSIPTQNPREKQRQSEVNAVSVSAMQPCSASFNSLPLPREYNITNMTAAKRYESVWNAFLNELSHNPTATLTSFPLIPQHYSLTLFISA